MSFFFSSGVRSAIPDSAIAQYDATQLTGLSGGETVSTFSDAIGSNDLPAEGNPVYRTNVVNSNPTVEVDGTDDAFGAAIGTFSQPNTIIAVARVTSTGSNSPVFDSQNGGSSQNLLRWGGSQWEMYAGGSVFGGGSNDGSSFYLLTGIFDGANSELRVNGSQVATGDPGSGSLDGISLGAGFNRFDFMGGDLGEVTPHNADLRATGDLSGEEQRMADKWGITI